MGQRQTVKIRRTVVIVGSNPTNTQPSVKGDEPPVDSNFIENGLDKVLPVGSNLIVFSGSQAWDNDDAQDTAHSIDIPLPNNLNQNAKYVLIIDNPSTESDLDLSFENAETLNGSTVYAPVSTSSVTKETAKAILVEGWMLGTVSRLTLSNATLIGASGAFTAYFTVRKV